MRVARGATGRVRKSGQGLFAGRLWTLCQCPQLERCGRGRDEGARGSDATGPFIASISRCCWLESWTALDQAAWGCWRRLTGAWWPCLPRSRISLQIGSDRIYEPYACRTATRSGLCFPFGPTTSSTSSSINSCTTPSPTPTLSASKPSLAAPTSSPSASWICAGSGLPEASKAVTTFGVDTFFMAVPPVLADLVGACHARNASGRGGRTAVQSSTRSRTTSEIEVREAVAEFPQHRKPCLRRGFDRTN